MKVSKNAYLQGFGVVVIVLALFRCAYPRVAMSSSEKAALDSIQAVGDTIGSDSIIHRDTLTTRDIVGTPTESVSEPVAADSRPSSWPAVPHPIYSVPGRFQNHFPDSQQVHLTAAEKYGVKPVADRNDAEKRMSELVYVGASPYYYVEQLKTSIPYLVPRASVLLNDIGRAFYDSLYVKGVPLHKIIVTSALRTKADVERLQRRNGNATENSCHLYGTTIDIAQNRYKTVYDPRKGPRREVQNDTLKWVLSEVLRDFRQAGRCYIKYEVKQGCFHITVR